eukprot:6358914-Prymnesium_polylepis.3
MPHTGPHAVRRGRSAHRQRLQRALDVRVDLAAGRDAERSAVHSALHSGATLPAARTTRTCANA